MSDQDNHLIKAIREDPTRRFAISAYRSSDQYQEKCAQLEKKLNGFEVVFLTAKAKDVGYINNYFEAIGAETRKLLLLIFKKTAKR